MEAMRLARPLFLPGSVATAAVVCVCGALNFLVSCRGNEGSGSLVRGGPVLPPGGLLYFPSAEAPESAGLTCVYTVP